MDGYIVWEEHSQPPLILPGYPFATRLSVQFLLMSPVVLLIGGLYFRWVERPCMRPDWPQQLMAALGRLKSRSLAAPAVE